MQTVAMEVTRLGATTGGATAHPLPRLPVAMTAVTMTDMHAGPHPCVMPTEGLTPMQRLAAAGSSCCLWLMARAAPAQLSRQTHTFIWPEQHQTGTDPLSQLQLTPEETCQLSLSNQAHRQFTCVFHLPNLPRI